MGASVLFVEIIAWCSSPMTGSGPGSMPIWWPFLCWFSWIVSGWASFRLWCLPLLPVSWRPLERDLSRLKCVENIEWNIRVPMPNWIKRTHPLLTTLPRLPVLDDLWSWLLFSLFSPFVAAGAFWSLFELLLRLLPPDFGFGLFPGFSPFNTFCTALAVSIFRWTILAKACNNCKNGDCLKFGFKKMLYRILPH